MGTPGSGRKRTPVKDRFSAEDEALSNIAREAEARLAAKRAARAEARDIRMRELERQQKEHSHRSYDRKWGQIHKWMEDAERARYSHRSSHHRPHLGVEDVLSPRNIGSHRPDPLKARPTQRSSSSRAYGDSNGTKRRPSSSHRDALKGLYYDQRNYSSLRPSKPPSAYSTRASSLYGEPPATSKTHGVSRAINSGLMRSASLASLGDVGLYSPYSSRTPSEYSYSSRASSSRSSPVVRAAPARRPASRRLPWEAWFSDDDTWSLASSDRGSHGPGASVVSAADCFGRSSRRGSVVSDVDDVIIPDVNSLDEKCDKQYAEAYTRDSLAAVEEKYKKAMVSNAQLDNEKNNLIYQVDTLKDVLEGQEEQMAEFYREHEEKSKELERQRHLCTVLQHKMELLKEGLRQRDELIEEKLCMQQRIDTITKELFDLQETLIWKDKKIGALERQKESFDCLRNERDALREELTELKDTLQTRQKHGLVIIPDGTPNGDVGHEPVVGAITVVSQEAAQVLESAGEGPLDVRLRKLAGEKEELLSQIRKLKLQLEEERQKYSRHDGTFGDLGGLENGADLQFIEMQRDANRQISEYKFKLSKAEQDMTTMEQNIGRLEGQVARYKTAAENAEKVEDELKADKRKLQRELRTALDKIEEMEMTNSHLVKRLEKMKANRTALLSQQ
ncbi:leucine-rich repeat flightless-interacting protein 2 isoform X10 [Monodelphis domestica]|uniref:leucine-rich repeat flightless-interacting protein 2 isoform X10 n=1 Tax=Monodelphis domestica TaxID=13616 RepID=UPI0024E1E368|nr:leucine-rich repeat flightless-interacting protein 2 isoform X10 [Monodelphis domestica]